MAAYKYGNLIRQQEHPAFDTACEPGEPALHAGIYRCVSCGDEIGIAKGHTLPPQNHHQHNPGVGPIKWKLIVATANPSK